MCVARTRNRTYFKKIHEPIQERIYGRRTKILIEIKQENQTLPVTPTQLWSRR